MQLFLSGSLGSLFKKKNSNANSSQLTSQESIVGDEMTEDGTII